MRFYCLEKRRTRLLDRQADLRVSDNNGSWSSLDGIIFMLY